jgi:hypothetical protein
MKTVPACSLQLFCLPPFPFELLEFKKLYQ